METIIEKANKILPFDLNAKKLLPILIAAKILSFAGFTIFMINR